MKQNARVTSSAFRNAGANSVYIVGFLANDGIERQIVYTPAQMQGILNAIAGKFNLRQGVLPYSILTACTLTGEWSDIKKGDVTVLEETHPLVQHGPSKEMKIIRKVGGKDKEIILSVGEKALAGDKYVYEDNKTRPDSLFDFEVTNLRAFKEQLEIQAVVAQFGNLSSAMPTMAPAPAPITVEEEIANLGNDLPA